jgi:hypothetical protein
MRVVVFALFAVIVVACVPLPPAEVNWRDAQRASTGPAPAAPSRDFDASR